MATSDIGKAAYLNVKNKDTGEIEKKTLIPPAPSGGDLGGISEEQLEQITTNKEKISSLNEELIDGRTDVDGNVHKNIGDAMRGQARKLRENLVVRQKEQPTDPNNNVWISDEDDEVEVPDMGEFNSLKEDLGDLQLGKIVYKVIKNSYVDKDTGEIKEYKNWDRTDYIDVSAFDFIYVTLENGSAYSGWYDENYKYIKRANIYAGSPYKIPVEKGASYLLISAENTRINNMTIYAHASRELKEHVNRLNDAVFKEELPKYYTEDYLKIKSDRLNQVDAFCVAQFLFITDYHAQDNAGNSLGLINKIFRTNNPSFVCFGGDAITNYSNKNEAIAGLKKIYNLFDDIRGKWFPIIGNHEFNDPSANDESKRLTLSEVQSIFNRRIKCDGYSGVTSYYVDDNISKIRYYFIGCDYKSIPYDDDVKWIVNSFLTIPDGYGVIILSHTGLIYDDNYVPTGLVGKIGYIAKALLSAYNKKTDFHSYIGEDKYLDYSSLNFTPICFITGHVHFDGVYEYSVSGLNGKIKCIATTTDSSEEYGGLNRTPGTKDEQAFDVISIDTAAKKIYFTRYGAGNDRTYLYDN